MTILITGATGHIGANLVRTLLAQGHNIRALVHQNRGPVDGLDIEISEGDICDMASLLDAFKDIDIVYHLAAHISILQDELSLLETVNIGGTRNVVEACLQSRVKRLVHFSSVHAMPDESMSLSEGRLVPEAEYHLYPPYDWSKASAEIEVYKGLEKGLDAIILRPTAIVGPHDYRPSLFGEALIRLANGKLPALISGGFNWVDVRDVVQVAIRAGGCASTGARYVIGGHWVSLCDVAKLVEQITGVSAPKLVCPLWLARIGAPVVTAIDRLTGKRPLYTSVSLKAISSHRDLSYKQTILDLDYHPRPFEETIVDTLRWFEEAGQLNHPLRGLSQAT